MHSEFVWRLVEFGEKVQFVAFVVLNSWWYERCLDISLFADDEMPSSCVSNSEIFCQNSV